MTPSVRTSNRRWTSRSSDQMTLPRSSQNQILFRMRLQDFVATWIRVSPTRRRLRTKSQRSGNRYSLRTRTLQSRQNRCIRRTRARNRRLISMPTFQAHPNRSLAASRKPFRTLTFGQWRAPPNLSSGTAENMRIPRRMKCTRACPNQPAGLPHQRLPASMMRRTKSPPLDRSRRQTRREGPRPKRKAATARRAG